MTSFSDECWSGRSGVRRRSGSRMRCARLRWMTRVEYPIAGTTLPVMVERDEPLTVRVGWD